MEVLMSRLYTMLLVAVFCGIVGVQFFMLGLLAEVLVRTYHESQGKPTFVIRDVVSHDLPGTPQKQSGRSPDAR